MLTYFSYNHQAAIEFYRANPRSSKYAGAKATGSGYEIDELEAAGILVNLGFQETNKNRPGFQLVVDEDRLQENLRYIEKSKTRLNGVA